MIELILEVFFHPLSFPPSEDQPPKESEPYIYFHVEVTDLGMLHTHTRHTHTHPHLHTNIFTNTQFYTVKHTKTEIEKHTRAGTHIVTPTYLQTHM